MVLCMIFAHDFWTRWFSVHGSGRMDNHLRGRQVVLPCKACASNALERRILVGREWTDG